MKLIPINHPYFKELPEEWGGKVPIKVSLTNTVRYVPEEGKPLVARSGVALRTSVGARGEVRVITRNGSIVPVSPGAFEVLEYLSIS